MPTRGSVVQWPYRAGEGNCDASCNRPRLRPQVFAATAPIAALGFGALLPLSLAPFGWWPLGLVSIAGWLWLLDRSAAGAALGFAYGVGKYGVGVSWVYVSIHLYGGASPVLAGFLVLLFVCGLALFTLLQGWLYVLLRASPPVPLETASAAEGQLAPKKLAAARHWRMALFNAWLFAAVWVLFEWLLTWFLNGFPWLYPGYGHLQTPLAHLVPLAGVSFASLGVVVSAAFLPLGFFLRGLGWRFRAAALAVAAAPWLLGLALSGVQWVAPAGERSAALVQGNVDQAVKWLPESRVPIIQRYLDLSEPYWGSPAHGKGSPPHTPAEGLIIWPEAAITLFEHEAGELLQGLGRRGEQSGAALVLGLPRLQAQAEDAGGQSSLGNRFQNAALALGDGEGRYIKRRLVPFGEYVPLEGMLRGLIEFFDLPMSRAAPGPRRQPLLRVGADAAALAICYEVAYADLMRSTAADADLLISITNDSWFGRSIGPLQHLQIAQARALENGRWLLRAANSGVTAILDPQGRIAARLPQFEQGVLTSNFQVMQGRTPYNRFGDAWLIALSAIMLLLAGLRKGSGPAKT